MKKLPYNYSLYHIDGSTYSLEYSEFCWEPSIIDLADKLQELMKLFTDEHLGDCFSIKGNEAIIVREGEVAISISLKGLMSKNAIMKEVEIFERD